jgi:hypothetical protein
VQVPVLVDFVIDALMLALTMLDEVVARLGFSDGFPGRVRQRRRQHVTCVSSRAKWGGSILRRHSWLGFAVGVIVFCSEEPSLACVVIRRLGRSLAATKISKRSGDFLTQTRDGVCFVLLHLCLRSTRLTDSKNNTSRSGRPRKLAALCCRSYLY